MAKRFKAKDLMISVLGEGDLEARDVQKLCLLNTRVCKSPTFVCDPTIHCDCTRFGSICACTKLGTACGQCTRLVTCLGGTQGCGQCTHFATRPCGAVTHGCAPGTQGCGGGCSQLISECIQGTGGGCGVAHSTCFGGTGFDFEERITPVVQPEFELQTVEDVQALKAELKATLEQLDEVEAGLEGPASVAEAEELEAKLEEALKEIKARKKELSKKK